MKGDILCQIAKQCHEELASQVVAPEQCHEGLISQVELLNNVMEGRYPKSIPLSNIENDAKR